ncbi:unnamed protein product [Blepharisma stoltei]|uniref:Uncharacterized protein n=1 Tax=Blepharisma stoltei TaxID=1481888 RepID=A0AAU9KEU8_9CILI|nr:unnamed protein product [Blepharisma stoltei]
MKSFLNFVFLTLIKQLLINKQKQLWLKFFSKMPIFRYEGWFLAYLFWFTSIACLKFNFSIWFFLIIIVAWPELFQYQ